MTPTDGSVPPLPFLLLAGLTIAALLILVGSPRLGAWELAGLLCIASGIIVVTWGRFVQMPSGLSATEAASLCGGLGILVGFVLPLLLGRRRR